jgi:hypothetical protein
VTDILGAAPLGLPQNEKRYVPADSEELLALGDETRFPPRNGAFEIRITDELREVLYLDEARLIAVDHPRGTVVYPTSKMHAAPPFPPHELWTLRPLATPRHAVRSDGLDVTAALARVDNQMVSPVRLRRPQLRGLAEPFSVTLDFGPLPVKRPLVLALTGWLHFGGGMANIAASLDPTLPFPFPVLEAELADGTWRKVDAEVGTPAGKTKTILVDLENKLPPVRSGSGSPRPSRSTGTARCCARRPARRTRASYSLPPERTDLHWRGYSRYADLPPSLPSPRSTRMSRRRRPGTGRRPAGSPATARWGISCARRDDQLVLLDGGDELALSFDAAGLPPPAPGMTRDFFLHVVGWDKDADFHVGQGWQLGPLPFQGWTTRPTGASRGRPNRRFLDQGVRHPLGRPGRCESGRQGAQTP